MLTTVTSRTVNVTYIPAAVQCSGPAPCTSLVYQVGTAQRFSLHLPQTHNQLTVTNFYIKHRIALSNGVNNASSWEGAHWAARQGALIHTLCTA